MQNNCKPKPFHVPQEALRANRRTSINIGNILRDLPPTTGTETNYKPTNNT